MAKRRGHENKTDLTPEEKLRAAYAHLCDGVAQHTIAALLGGVNQGRVAEAVKEVKAAVGWTRSTADEQELPL